MTIDLPPRRKLPADVKERMRPAFSEDRPRRNHTPLAAAAGVALLVAGGVVVAPSLLDRADTANGRVVAPSHLDLERCRAALQDESWPSSRMVVFDGRKVLAGEDNRFCELTRSRAYVPSAPAPALVETGTVTFRTDHVIAGVTPLGARTAVVREGYKGDGGPGTEVVVTPDFFIAYSVASSSISDVVFDNRTMEVPPSADVGRTKSADSFESGDGNPGTPINLLARCTDNAIVDGTRPGDLQGWQPLLVGRPGNPEAVLLAHRDNRDFATCYLHKVPADSGSLQQASPIPADPQGATMVSGYLVQNNFLIAARTNRTARTVEVSSGDGPAVTADVVDGFFIVKVPGSGESLPGGGVRMDFETLNVTARNADKQIVYRGGVA
ncbi:MAG: hypothetical protein QOF58_1567 [Pseudonocardiales bacterium]|jgi:hypothetical protein|nr:hypothetical protein [Pseudonocardiales bacterium]